MKKVTKKTKDVKVKKVSKNKKDFTYNKNHIIGTIIIAVVIIVISICTWMGFKSNKITMTNDPTTNETVINSVIENGPVVENNTVEAPTAPKQ